MYRIRFHGRGGQGMKTASRILGSAFFYQGYEVQDAPRYGAERRGAPVFAYVRASGKRINERGVIHSPDLAVVADESLFVSAPDAITAGFTDRGIILVVTSRRPGELQALAGSGAIITLPDSSAGLAGSLSTLCASASARLTGVISPQCLEKALRDELAPLGNGLLNENIFLARSVYDRMAEFAGSVTESPDIPTAPPRDPGWIDLPLHDTFISAPAIRDTGTSALNMTGSWRTARPVVKRELCSRCSLCALYCPDSAISAAGDGFPSVDYDHCKGCMICVSVCPRHAIEKIQEHETL